jgi:hypothetical protein
MSIRDKRLSDESEGAASSSLANKNPNTLKL